MHWPEPSDPISTTKKPKAFASTNWSLVLKAGQANESETRQRALSALFRTYWKPLYGWLRNTGQTAQDAEDLIQQLFHEILSNDSLNSIGKEGGKFRSFLITALKNRTIDGYRRQSAAKRGGGIPLLTLDLEQGESFVHQPTGQPGALVGPEVEYDRQWAKTLIESAAAELRANYISAGREALFLAIQPCLFGMGGAPAYEELSAKLGISKGAITMSVKRMRERFGELIAQKVAETVADPSEVREEIRYLLSLFACE